MIELNIPGRGVIQLDHLVCDVNGTLAEDGRLIQGLKRPLAQLSDRLTLHLLTADTHGRQAEIDKTLNTQAVIINKVNGAGQKRAYIQQLDAARVVAIGQGENDAAMLAEAGLGICILSREGLATSALKAADLVLPDIHAALEMLDKPIRIVATLRK